MNHHPRRPCAFRTGLAFLVLAALLVPAGCAGKKAATVSGKVTYRGRPVPLGAIYFHGSNDQMAMGLLHEDGSFTVTDVPLGQVKALVRAQDPGVYAQQLTGPAGVAPKTAPAAFVAVPDKYADLNTTDLVFTIAGETRDLEVDLQ
jgi:hypothetical protein